MTALLSVYMYMEYGPNMLCYAIVTSVSWCEEAKYTFLRRGSLASYLLCLSGIERYNTFLYTSLYIVGDLRVPLLEFLYFTWPLIGKCLDLTFLFSALSQKILAHDSRRLKGQCHENCFQTESVGS